jgi:type II secretory pathway pseudopilin PulG
LIELLVIIAIIGILASLLLTAVSKAKSRATMVTDLNNTRQIMLAMHIYTANESDYLPRPGWQIHYPCWAYGYPFPYSRDGNYDAVHAGQTEAVKKGQLYPYLTTAKLLVCPGDKPDSRFYQREMYISSYVWNGALSSYDTRSPKTHKLSQFKSTCILQWESDETIPITFNDGGNWPYEGFTRRHGGSRSGDSTQNTRSMVTVGLFDGSSKRMSAKELYRLSGGLGTFDDWPPPVPTEMPNELWCNPGSPKGIPKEGVSPHF